MRELPGARLRIDVHHEVFEPGGHSPRARRGRGACAPWPPRTRQVELCEHDYFTDAELWDYLLGLDVSVLPYRFGTHSGWLEACHDLGTAVIAPTCGFYAEQQPCASTGTTRTGSTPARSSPRSGARTPQRPAPRASVAERRRASGARWPPRTGALYAAAAGVSALRDRHHRRRAASRSPSRSPAGSRRTCGRSPTGCAGAGTTVTLFAGPGSDPRLGVELLDLRRPRLSAAARADVSMTAAGRGSTSTTPTCS